MRVDERSVLGSAVIGRLSNLQFLTLMVALATVTGCSKPAWLKHAVDLNAQLGFLVEGKFCESGSQEDALSCESARRVMLSEGMQISVQSTSLRGKGTNTATPIIANWKWTIPPAGAELQSLSRDDLFALRYLSSGATCKETCPSELPQWFLDQPFERSTRVSDIFMDPRIVAGPKYNYSSAPTAAFICKGIRTFDGGPQDDIDWPTSSTLGQPLDEHVEAKSLRFEHRASTKPSTLRAFTGSDWAFSGNLVTLDQAFENGWLVEKAKDRLLSRQSLEAYIPVQTGASWEPSYRPVCTTLGEVEKEIVAAGFRFDGLSRRCAYFAQPKLLRLQDKKESGSPLSIEDVRVAMAAVCTSDNAERVLLRISDTETQVRLSQNSLEVPRSALADLLLAPGDRIYSSPRKR